MDRQSLREATQAGAGDVGDLSIGVLPEDPGVVLRQLGGRCLRVCHACAPVHRPPPHARYPRQGGYPTVPWGWTADVALASPADTGSLDRNHRAHIVAIPGQHRAVTGARIVTYLASTRRARLGPQSADPGANFVRTRCVHATSPRGLAFKTSATLRALEVELLSRRAVSRPLPAERVYRPRPRPRRPLRPNCGDGEPSRGELWRTEGAGSKVVAPLHRHSAAGQPGGRSLGGRGLPLTRSRCAS